MYLESPVIFIPRNSKSREIIMVEIGSLSLQSTFDHEETTLASDWKSVVDDPNVYFNIGKEEKKGKNQLNMPTMKKPWIDESGRFSQKYLQNFTERQIITLHNTSICTLQLVYTI
jgi:hypothetical protein